MRKAAKGVFALAIVLGAVLALKGSALVLQSALWSSTADLTAARAGASAALLPDGRILITGGDSGSGPLAGADFFNTDGTISVAPPMAYARSQHVSVALPDGRILVVGGLTTGGSATNSAEIFDPVANSWTSVSLGMAEARSGATAVLLQDGRVLVAGGQNGTTISSTIEIFNPATASFSAAGIMSSPRAKHAMTVLQDGRVLIVGGFNGSVSLGSTDIFDPVAGTVSAGPNLATARYGHSATTLLNGQVAVIGGNNGNASSTQMDVTPAELLDPAAGAFSTPATNLATPREGHLAILLPNNNNVLIVGGTSGGTVTASAELFSPQASSTGAWNYNFSTTASLAAARSNASGSANQVNAPSSVMQRNGIVIIAGGSGATGAALNSTEGYGYATVQTDRSDYAPGTVVTITGSGWKPGETVTLQLVESPLIDTHGPFTTQADSNGNISNSSFITDSHDIGVLFYLTATGSISQALTAFTDRTSTTTTLTDNGPNPSVVGQAVSFKATVSPSVGSEGCIQLFDGGTAISGQVRPTSSSVTFSITTLSAGTHSNITAQYQDTGSCPTKGTNFNGSTSSAVSQTVNQAPVITSAPSTTFTVGTAGTFTVTATGFPTPTLSESGTLPSGVAFNASTGSLSGTPALGTVGNHAITFTASNGVNPNATQNFTLTVAKATPSFSSLSSPTIAYGTTPTSISGKISYGSLFPSGTVAITLNAVTQNASISATDGTFSSSFATGSLATGSYTITYAYAGDANFNAPSNASGTLTVSTATPTVTEASSLNSSTYGQLVTITATVTNNSSPVTEGCVTFVDNSNGGATLAGPLAVNSGQASFSTYSLTAGSHDIQANYKDAGGGCGNTGNNFNNSHGNITQGVSKATPTITWANPADITYGTALSGTQLNATFTAVVNGSTVTVAGAPAYTPASGTVLNAGSAQNLTVNFTPTDTTDYNTATKTVQINVNQKPVTAAVTANNRVYDGTTTATQNACTLSGVIAADSGNVGCSASTLAFTDKNVSNGKTVNVSGISLSGSAAPNYVLSSTTATTTANITARPLTVTATANTKVYDSTTSASATPAISSGSLATGDIANFSETYDNKNVGSGKSLTPSGTVSDGNAGNNYSFTFTPSATGVINAEPLTVTAAANTKTYDATTSASATPTVTSGALQGTDTASFSETYDTKNAGTGKTMTPIGTVSDGNSGNNYAYTFTAVTTGVINARPLTVTATANTKTYDATTSAAATPTITSGALQGSDTANFSEMYGSKNAGTSLALTPSGSVSDGNGGSNYAVTFVSSNSGVINPAALTLTALTNTKTYDATTSASATPTTTGLQGSDTVTGLAEVYTDPNAGTGKTLTVSAYAINDGNSGNNYTVSKVDNSTGSINKANATISVTPYSLTYDGNAHTATGTAKGVVNETLSGLDLGHTTHTNAGAYSSDYWMFTDATGNYNNVAATTITDTINKATPVVGVSFAASLITYDGNSHPASASASGVGGADLSGHGTLTVTYTPGGSSAPVNAGSYTASAQFVSSDSNYTDASSGAPASLTINQASSTTAVTCPASVTYNTMAQTPCTTTVTGAGGLSQSLSVSYANNINAGTASASASFAGDANHTGSSGSANFTILQATPTVSFTGAPASATFGAQFVVAATTNSTASAMISASGSCTISGTTVTITSGVGTCNLHVAWPADTNYLAAAADQSTVAQPAPVAITVPNTTVTYDGSPKTVSVTASPAVSFSVTYTGTNGTTYGPSASAPTEPGTYTVFAAVTDAVDYVGSSSGTLTINKKDPALVFAPRTGMPAQTAYGTRVYFDLTTAHSPCPTGLVQFFIDSDSTPSSTATLTGTECTLPVSAEFSTATLPPGTHTVYVTYAGDAHYLNETSAQVSQVVVADATMVTLATSAGEVFVGDSVTFTATVTPSTAIDGSATAPAGTVQFFDGSTQLGQTALTGNTATFSTSSLPAGPHSVTATYVSANGDFTGSSSPVSVETVDKITPTITWPTPTAIVYGTKLDNTQLNATATDVHNSGVPVSGTFAYNPPASTVLAVGPFNLAVTFTPTDGNTYTTQTASVTITVNPATLTVTADNASRSYGADNPPFTFQYSGFVNNETSAVVVTPPTCSSVADHTSSVGTYDIVCSGGVSPNYSFNYVKGTLTVNPAALTITAKDKSKTYGDTVTFAGTEFTTSTLYNSDTVSSVTLASAGAPATAAVGTYSITPSAAVGTGLSNYNITYANGTLTVNPAALVITAKDASKTYGQTVTFAGTEFTSNGLVNTDAVSSVTLTSAGAPSGAAAGSYSIVPSAAIGTGLSNYTITYKNGTLTVNKAHLTITADDKSKTYDGAVFSPFTATITGFVNGENLATSGVTGSASFSGPATTAVNAGTYPSTPAVGTLSAANYDFPAANFVNGTLTINKAHLTVTADNKAKTYDGVVFTAFTASLSGFVNNETDAGLRASGALSGTAAFTGAATTAVNAGSYTITPTPGTLSATNYDFPVSNNGTLTINKAHLIVTADNKTKTYDGAAFTAFTATIAGFVNNENSSVITGAPSFSGTAVGAINAGSYVITPAIGSLSTTNYDFPTFNNGTLTINQADAVISVNGYSGVYDGNPHGATGSARGVEASPADLTSLLNFGSTFTDVPGGTAHWTFAGNTNYKPASGDASIVITQADAAIKINGYSGTYDGNPHGATGSATGVKAEDLSSLLNLGATFTNVPGGSANWTFAGNTDYKSASGTASVSIAKANASITVTPYSVTYDGNPHTATDTVTGVKGEALAGLSLSGTTHTGAGDYPNDPWTFTDVTGNYNNTSGTVHDSIAKANAAITVTPYSVTYDANAHTATGSAIGVKGEALAGLDLSATTHTNAGTYTDPWTFTDSTGNYNNASNTVSEAIAKADSTTTVTCPTSVTYNGSPQTPCSAGIAGVGGLNQSATVSYANNTNAGTASASASFAGDANHNGSSGSAQFTINKADSSTVVTFESGPYVYRGTPFTATAQVTGAGGLSSPVAVVLSGDCTNVTVANGCTASATYAGDANHNPSSDSKSITITQAPSNTTVICSPSTVTYNGTAQTPCSAAVTGVGGLNQPLTVSYTNNVNAGTATASAAYGGDANHTASNSSANFTISQASSTTTVTCPTSVTYNGSAQTPCTATATGVGGLNQGLTVSYSNNTNAGTAGASASFAGDTNHTGSSGSANFTINPAPLTITASSGSMIYGGPVLPITPGYSGFVQGQNASNLTTQPSCGTNATSTSPVGAYVISWCTGAVDSNYAISYVNGAVTINQATTTTTVTSSLSPSTYMQLVTFTATVAPQFTGVPTGTVTFSNNGSQIGTGTLAVTSCGTPPCPVQASFGTTSLPDTGTDNITATYSGDNNFLTSNSTFAQTVLPAPTVNLNPLFLSFGNQNVGTTSKAATITLSNIGDATLTIAANGISITGANPGDFTLTTNCGSTLAATKSCNIYVAFAPTATGVRSASVQITDNDDDATNAQQFVSLTGAGLSTITGASLYTDAIFAGANGCGSVTFSGGSIVDSFNSSLGYAASHQNSGGNVATNGNVTLNGSKSAIYGSAGVDSMANGSCSKTSVTGVTANGGAQVSGGLVPLNGPVTYPMPPAPNPAPPTTAQSISGPCGGIPGCSDTGTGNKPVTLAPGQYGNLSISGGSTAHFSKGTYNINSLTLSGKSILYVDSGPVVIHLGGASLSGANPAMDLTGGSIENPSGNPASLQFVYAGSRGLNLSGGSASYATVYAPQALVNMSGGTDFFGSIIGSTVTSTGGTAIHYDANLLNILGGSYLWFVAVINNVTGLPNSQVKLYLTNSSIQYTANGVNYNVSVPNAVVTFNSVARSSGASTSYDLTNSRWNTLVASKGLTGNTFVTGVAVPVPAGGFPTGIQNVAWSAAFSTDTPGVGFQWQWGAAVYTSFSTTYTTGAPNPTNNFLGVNPEDGSADMNGSDPAGTPETYKASVTFGATGGGLTNYTGFLSTGAGVVPTIAPMSVSPSSLDFGGQTQGTTTAIPITAVLTNNDSSSHNLSSISIVGTNAADYSLANGANNCVGMSSLASGASCTLYVTFKPSDIGARTAKIAINDDANNSPQTVYLTGIGQ